MLIAETVADVQYITNPAGDRTDVIILLPIWESLLTVLEEMIKRLEVAMSIRTASS
jgi:hypothetical protein